jgi:Rrf2 family protein
MKVTFKGDYALKAVLELALNNDQKILTSHEMARNINAPVKFLEQILLELKKGGIIQSKRGNEGGYSLSKAPQEISVGEVIRLIEGPIEPIACVRDDYSSCEDIRTCIFRNIFKRVSIATAAIIDNITFAELAKQVHAEQQVPAYSI